LLYDVWNLARQEYKPVKVDVKADKNLQRRTHQTIRKVSEDLETFAFNTAVAAIMELRNVLLEVQRLGSVSHETWAAAIDSMLLLLAPVAPHITEELWEQRGKGYSIHQQAWPSWDEEIAREDMITLVVQVNGKVRDKLTVPEGSDDSVLKELALASEKIQKWLEGKEPRQVIAVKGKLVNIVL